jgi:Ca2+-binding RTX toxin-like protein/PKD repeat protein
LRLEWLEDRRLLITAAGVADSFQNGFNAVEQFRIGDFAATVNLPDQSLPLVTNRLADQLQLVTSLDNVVRPVNLMSAVNMNDLGTLLVAAGFSIEHALTDSQLAALPQGQYADLLRATQTYTLPTLHATTPLTHSGIDALTDLQGVDLGSNLDVVADVQFTVRVGVDTTGFYLLPGDVLTSHVTADGAASATLGSYGAVTGQPQLDLTRITRLVAAQPDGLVRVDELSTSFAQRTASTQVGNARLNAAFQFDTFDHSHVGFDGKWSWSVDTGGFTYAAGQSGFDRESLLASLAGQLEVGVDTLAGQADEFGRVVQETPLVGKTLTTELSEIVASAMQLNVPTPGSIENYLSGRGYRIISRVEPAALIDGSYLGQDLFKVEFAYAAAPAMSFRVDSLSNPGATDDPLIGNFNVSSEIGAETVSMTYKLIGPIAGTPNVSLGMTFGVNADRGPYVGEQGYFRVDASTSPLTGQVTGKAQVGRLNEVHAESQLILGTDTILSLNDSDNDPNERLYLLDGPESAFEVADLLNQPGRPAVSVAGDLRLHDLELRMLRADAGAVFSQVLPSNLTWYAEAVVPLRAPWQPAGQLMYRVDLLRMPDVGDIAAPLMDLFRNELDTHNPIPEDWRVMLGVQSLPLPDALLDLIPVEILGGIDPNALFFETWLHWDDLGSFLFPAGRGSIESLDHVQDGVIVHNLFSDDPCRTTLDFLSGKVVNLITLDVNKHYESRRAIPLVSHALVASFFGLVNLFADVHMVPDLELDLEYGAGLDSSGLYFMGDSSVADCSGANDCSNLTARLTFDGSLDFLGSLTGTVGLSKTFADAATSVAGILGPINAYLPDRFELKLGDLDIGVDVKVELLAGYTYQNSVEVAKSSPLDKLVVDPLEGVPGYAEFGAFARRLGNHLLDLGVGAGARAAASLDVGPTRLTILSPSILSGHAAVIGRFSLPHPGDLAFRMVGRDTDQGCGFDSFLSTSSGTPPDEGVLPPVLQWVDSHPVPVPSGFPFLAFGTEMSGAFESIQKDALEAYEDALRSQLRNIGANISMPDIGGMVLEILGDVGERLANAAQAVVDWAAPGLEKVGEVGQQAARAVGEAAAEVGQEVDRGLERFDQEVLQPLGAGILQGVTGLVNSIHDLGDYVFGSWEELEVPDRRTFNVQQIGNELVVTWDPTLAQNYLASQAADVTVAVIDGQLIIDGPDFTRSETVATKYNTFKQEREYEDADVLHRNLFAIDASRISRVVVVGSPFGDKLVTAAGTAIPVRFEGGDGADLLVGGEGNDELIGGGGDDRLVGNGGDDGLDGGDGNDKLFGGAGNNTLLGGNGDDYLDVAAAPPGLVRSGEVNTLNGGDGNDLVIGSPGRDSISGGGGDDILYAGEGDDTVYGGDGNDQVFGEGGNDVLVGGGGDDYLVGADGNDQLQGGDGDDQLYGDNPDATGTGNDTLQGDAGQDVLFGGGGDDVLYGGAGADALYGNSGNDLLVGAALGDPEDPADGNDALFGGEGNDTLQGGPSGPGRATIPGNPAQQYDLLSGDSGSDVLLGGSGPDILLGGEGDDHLEGGEGDDILDAVSGHDELFGGGGDDQLLASADLSGALGCTLDGGDGNDLLVGSPANDTILGGEGNDQISGSSGNDIIDAGMGDDTIYGDLGDDQITAGGGDDIVYGGIGNDVIYGGAGNDIIYGDTGEASLSVPESMLSDTIYGGSGNDLVYAGAGADLAYGGEGDDTLYGQAGDDALAGGSGNDLVDGGEGCDLLWGDEEQFGRSIFVNAGFAADNLTPLIVAGASIDGSSGDGDDRLEGGDGSDWLFGGGGRDQLSGGAAGDYLDAGSGNDNTQGGSGADVILGGLGDDVLSGGDDQDTLDGGQGNDSLFGGEGGDMLIGASGDDLLEGQGGEDLLWGGCAAFTREAMFAVGFEADAVVPRIINGLPVDGEPADGRDTLRGGDDRDWLFGGSDADTLFGDSGADYLDGGAGNDAVAGGVGDDVVRGGSGDDLLHGNEGIDRLYGDDGDDSLFGDAGTGGVQQGQELWGGAGNDRLYAFAPTTNPAVETTLVGDALYGGPGNDWLFGNLRQEILSGDEGDDRLEGDSLAGPSYLVQTSAATIGANDRLLGGSGEDYLYGGGGDDVLFGGADSDRLEGQQGADSLYGGSGIDVLVLDVAPAYGNNSRPETINGHYGNAAAGDVLDDGATDILLIEGDRGGAPNDFIRVGQAATGQLQVEYTGRVQPILVDWRDLDGTPLVEQFRVAGAMGDDYIEFVNSGSGALDLADLIGRSTDWVAVVDGGPGTDTIIGTSGRDRLDGGTGSDTLFGMAGDDRLWGDLGDGLSTDHDVLYGGQGNDDLIGGQGTNELYAWSHDPFLGGQFGVFTDAAGNLYDNDGGGIYTPEDTGLNRVLGGPGDDDLFGGTGLDFLYGAGGGNRLFDRRGVTFQSSDSGLAGDDWKEYARQTDRVWYVSGSNADDTMRVDFVTEPGLLGNHHLVTRYSNNNGSLTFAAQVRLDVDAQDSDGRPIWNPDDAVIDLQTLDRVDVPRLGEILPTEGDFFAIIIEALAGNDEVIIGPTVQKTVWVDAGPGDDTVSYEPGKAILVDQTETNNTRASAYDFQTISGNSLLKGLTIHSPGDQDWYAFRLASPAQAGDVLRITSISPDDGMTMDLTTDNGVVLAQADASGQLPLGGLVLNDVYYVQVASNQIPTTYQLEFLCAGPADREERDFASPPAVRRDVMVGGEGNDRLAGGPGEDWIFGGLGNDVLAGGLDRQAEDLLFGGPGDDIFQIIPDDLPQAFDSSQTIVPTLTDEFFGGPGDDQVLFFGGDSDESRRPVPDYVAMGYNRQLSRYEFSSLVWDTANQGYVCSGPTPAMLVASADLVSPDLGGDLTFSLAVNGQAAVAVTVPHDGDNGTADNQTIEDVVDDLNAALLQAGVHDQAVARHDDYRIVLMTTATGAVASLAISFASGNLAASQLGLANGQSATGVDSVFQQRYLFYRPIDVEETVIRTYAGDDVVHADPGYRFPNSVTEWGFAPSDRPEGASLTQLMIYGGDGNDWLFGGPENDEIDGGEGHDVLVGGEGDDTLYGNNGADQIYGDRYTGTDVPVMPTGGNALPPTIYQFTLSPPLLTATPDGPPPFNPPGDEPVVELANATTFGLGDSLVADGSGPLTFENSQEGDNRFTLDAGQTERWYRFTTRGDGLPGDQIAVSPFVLPAQTVDMMPYAAMVTADGRLAGYSELTVGTSQQFAVVLELDLSSFAPLAARPELVEQARLDFGAPASRLRVLLLEGKGDGLITAADRAREGVVVNPANLAAVVSDALRSGRLRLTFRIEPRVAPDFEVRGIEPVFHLVQAEGGLVLDLLDLRGEVVAADRSIVDLRGVAAGTYWLRVHRLSGQPANEPMPFHLEFRAPAAGQFVPKQNVDNLFGGEQNDTLVGGTGRDFIRGEGGADRFVSEGIEALDFSLSDGDVREAPAPADLSTNQPWSLDPVIPFSDPRVELRVAQAAGVSIVPDAAGGHPARSLTASDLAQVVTLDLSGLMLSDLAPGSGIEYLTNLRALNAAGSGSPGWSLAALAPHTDMSETALLPGVTLGLGNLEFLVLDPVQSAGAQAALVAVGQLDQLRLLSMDMVDYGAGSSADLGPLDDLAALNWLSLSRFPVGPLEPLTALRNLQHLNLRQTDTRSIDGLLGQTILDNFDTGYAEVGTGWAGDVHEGAFNGDYRVLPGLPSNSTAVFEFADLTPGAYDVFATWPADNSRTQHATYAISNGIDLPVSVEVDQRWEPEGDLFGGRPWQLLASQFTTQGTLRIELSGGGDGSLTADAVRLVRPVLPHLQTIDLTVNPLDNAAYEYVLEGLRATRPGGYPPVALVDYDPNPEPPAFTTRIGPQTLSAGQTLSLDLTDLAFAPVTFSADTDLPDVHATIFGSELRIDATAGFTGTAVVTLTARDRGGRTTEQRFTVDVGTNAITGIKFHDLDADGQRDPGEPGQEGRSIYLDLNRNNQWDEGEPVTVSDLHGDYEFHGLAADVYAIREMPWDGWASPNRPPVADAGGPYMVSEGTTIMLDGVGSYDPDLASGGIATYEWDLDYNGSFTVDVTGVRPIVTVPDDFPQRTVALRVTDADGASTIAYTTLQALNVPPDLTMPSDRVVAEGSVITLGQGAMFEDRGFSDATWGTVEEFTATIDWGDGTPLEQGTVVTSLVSTTRGTVTTGRILGSHTYGDNGDYTVTVTVSDDDGGFRSGSLRVSVYNEAPSVAQLSLRTATVANPFTLTSSFTDGGFGTVTSQESFQATVDWGDGSAPQSVVPQWTVGGAGVPSSGTAVASHTYVSGGYFSITVTLRDDDGGTCTRVIPLRSIPVSPGSWPPIAVPGGPYVIDQGTNLVLNGSGSIDPSQFTGGPDRVREYRWTIYWGGMPIERTSSSVITTVPWSDLAAIPMGVTIPVVLEARSSTLLSSVSTTTLVIDPNHAPVPFFEWSPEYASPNQIIHFDASGSAQVDTNRAITRYEWDFGDGDQPLSALVPVINHKYSASGIYSVALTVYDDDSPPKWMPLRRLIDVTAGNDPPVAVAGGPYVVQFGDDLVLDASASFDPDDTYARFLAEDVEFAWDLQGDGLYEFMSDQPVLRIPTADFASRFGTIPFGFGQTVSLRVTDGYGAQSNANTTVIVVNDQPVRGDAGLAVGPVQVMPEADLPSLLEGRLIVSKDSLIVPEGGSASLWVSLSRPLSGAETVQLTIARTGGDADISLAGSPQEIYVLNADNWQSGVTLTLDAADDEDGLNGAARWNVTADGWAPARFAATENDNDRAIELSASSLEVGEGQTGTYQVRLKGRPAGDVTVFTTPAVTDGGLSLVSGGDLVFTPQNWNVFQTVVVRALEDADAADASVAFSSAAEGWGQAIATATAVDDERVLLVSSASLNVPEGGNALLGVRLGVQPAGEVTVTISRTSGDADLGLQGVTSLVFTLANWDHEQFVTLRAADDPDAISGDAQFAVSATGWTAAAFTAVEIEDDRIIERSDYSTDLWEGSALTLGLRLAAQPNGSVIVTTARTSGAGGADVAGGGVLVFTPENWDQFQLVTIRAAEDDDTDSAQVFFTSSAPGWQPISSEVDVFDNDLAIVLTAHELAVDEGGTAATGVQLSARPVSDVLVTMRRDSGDEDLMASGNATFVFTPDNWDQPQSLVLSARDDADGIDGVAGFILSAPSWQAASLTAVEADDDRVLETTVVSLDVNESATATYGVRLGGRPDGAVLVTTSWVSGDQGLRVEEGAALTFTPANWASFQNVTIAAAEDADTVTGTARFVSAATDWLQAEVGVRAVDNDLRILTTLVSATVEESRTTTYRVRLAGQPQDAVVVTTQLTSGDSDLVVQRGGTLTFNSFNWAVYQEVTIAGAEDQDAVDGTGVITSSAQGWTSANVTVTEADNDRRVVVSSPTIRINEGGVAELRVRLAGRPQAGSAIVVTAARVEGDTDLAVLQGAMLTFDAADWNQEQTVTLAAAPDVDLTEGTAEFEFSTPGWSSGKVTVDEGERVDAGEDRTVTEGERVALHGSFTGSGSLDQYVSGWRVSIAGNVTVAEGDGNDFEFTPVDNGIYTVAYTVADGAGHTRFDSLILTVLNAAPAVEAGPDQISVEVGQPVFLAQAAFTDTGSADRHTALIDWGDGTSPVTVEDVAGTLSGSHSYAQKGVYQVTVTVTDDDGGAGKDSFLVPVAPPVPVVDLSQTSNGAQIDVYLAGAQLVVRQETTQGWTEYFRHEVGDLRGLLIYGSAYAERFRVNIAGLSKVNVLPAGLWIVAGEGTEVAPAGDTLEFYDPGPPWTYITHYQYTATGPEAGVVAMDQLTVHFFQFEPIVDNLQVADRTFSMAVIGDQTIVVEQYLEEGRSIIHDGGEHTFESVTFTNPSDSMTVSAGGGDDTILIGDLGRSWTASVAAYGEDGNDNIDASAFTGDVLLGGGNGDDVLVGGNGNNTLIPGRGSDSFSGDAGDEVVIVEGTRLPLAVRLPGLQHPQIHWGDGTTEVAAEESPGVVSGSHVYPEDGSYTITVTDGDSNVASLRVTVTNASPILTDLNATSVREGETAIVSGRIVDPGTQDAFTLSFDWGDGTAPEMFFYPASTTTFRQTHRYLDDRPNGNGAYRYLVEVTVVDDDGGRATSVTGVTVYNMPPAVVAQATTTRIGEGGVIDFTALFTDRGTLDTHSISWDFGDGSPRLFDVAALSHTYAAEGQYVLTLTVADDDGGVGTDRLLVVVDNLPPSVVAGGPYSINEGGTLVLDGSAASDPGQDLVFYEWDLDYDLKDFHADVTGLHPSIAFSDNLPTRTIALRATDSGGLTGIDTTTLTVDNVAPTPVIVSIDKLRPMGEEIIAVGSATDPAGANDTLTYAWTVNKGGVLFASQSGAGLTSFSFTPDDNGSYQIVLTVSDEDGGSTTVDQTISVANVAPSPTIVSISDPKVEGTQITATGAATDPAGANDTLTYAWTVNKGGVLFASQSGVGLTSFSFTPDDNASYQIVLTVSDEDGGSTTVDQTISVANVAPSPTIVSVSDPKVEGTQITVSGAATDPAGANDTLTYAWTVNKGGVLFASQSGVDLTNFSFTPDDNGSYQIVLTVSDEDGGSTTVDQTISVDNVAPSPTIVSISEPKVEGTQITVTGVATDPAGANDTLTYAWTMNKGGVLFASQTGVDLTSFRFTPDDNASYQIVLTVSDEDGGSTTVDQTISVANVAPVITAISNSSPGWGGALQGEPVTVMASFSDAGTRDTHTAVVDWGDGTTSAGTVTEANGSGTVAGSHVYAAGGFYTITVTVTDDDGASDDATTETVVSGIGLHDGVLTIIGTNGRDLIHVEDGWWGEIHVAARFDVRDSRHGGHDGDRDDGEGHGGWHRGRNGWRDGCYYATFDASDVTSILIIGCGGDDRLQVSGELSIPATIDGGGGDDAIWGGSGNDTIVDLLGVNEIHAGQGNDSVTVGDGDNRIWTDGGHDAVSAGDGANEVHAGRGNNVITVGHGANRIWTDGGADRIIAGDGGNEIHSGDGNDVIITGSGHDKIWSDGGDDWIDAGGGNDVIDAGAGNDLVRAGAGNDRVQGGAGDDILVGGDGDDLLNGDQGRDLLIGGNGADRIVGNADEDVLIAGWTAYDANDTALLALMKEWTGCGRYGTRVANITNGTGSTGGYRLVGDDGPQQTVFNDNEVDQLTGSQGQDWFFANRVADNGGAIDRVLDQAGNELWNDTDF